MDIAQHIQIKFCHEIVKSTEKKLDTKIFNNISKEKIFIFLKELEDNGGNINLFSNSKLHNKIKNAIKLLYDILLKYIPEEQVTQIFENAYIRVCREYTNTTEIEELSQILPYTLNKNIKFLKDEVIKIERIIDFMASQFNNPVSIERYIERFNTIKKNEVILFGNILSQKSKPATKLQLIFERGYNGQ